MIVPAVLAAIAGALFGILVARIILAIIRVRRENQRAYRTPEESLDSDPSTFVIPSVNTQPVFASSWGYTATVANTLPGVTLPMAGKFVIAPPGGIHPVEPVPEPEAHDGPFTGWRLYHVGVDQHMRVRLTGTYDCEWATAEFSAECGRTGEYFRQGALGDHSVVAAHLKSGTCTCGIYLMKGNAGELAMNGSAFSTSTVCIAQCSAWGTVLECEDGYRAEHARIDRIFINDANPGLMAQLREKYGVPVLSLQEHATPLLKGRL